MASLIKCLILAFAKKCSTGSKIFPLSQKITDGVKNHPRAKTKSVLKSLKKMEHVKVEIPTLIKIKIPPSREFKFFWCDPSHIIVEKLGECKKFAKLQNLSLSLSALLMSGWFELCLCIFDVKVFSMMNQQKSRRALVSISCPFVNEQYVMIWRTPKFCKPDFANFIQQRMF